MKTEVYRDVFKALVGIVAGTVGIIVLAVLAAPIYVFIGMPGKQSLPPDILAASGWASLVGLVCWALVILVVLVRLLGHAIEWAGYRFARGAERAGRRKPDDPA